MRFAVLLLLLSPSFAQAVQLGQPKVGSPLLGARLDVSNSFYFKWNQFLDDNPEDSLPPAFSFVEWVNRLTADLKIGGFTAGAQIDLVGIAPGCDNAAYRAAWDERFPDSPCASPNVLKGEGWGPHGLPQLLVVPEKLYVRYTSPHFAVELGDFTASIGRGIVLSFVKKPEIDVDNSLRGGRIDLNFDAVDLHLMAGLTNPQEVSMELRNQLIRKVDPGVIAAGSLRLRPHAKVEVGAHAVGYDLTEQPAVAAGGTLALNALGEKVDLFVEGDGFGYQRAEGDAAPSRGYAIYGTMTAYAGPVTLLVEGKRYKDAQWGRRPGPVVPTKYAEPPTLEFETAISSDVNGSIQSNDITAGRVQADGWINRSNTTLTGSFLVSYDREPHAPTSLQHEVALSPWIQLDQPISAGKAELRLRGYLGYRHDLPLRAAVPGDAAPETRDRLENEYLRSSGLLFGNIDFGASVGIHAWEWVSYYRRYHWSLEEDACWDLPNGNRHCDRDDGWISIENAISYTLMGKYTAAVHLDYTDDPVVQSPQNGGAIGNLKYNRDFRSSWYLGGEFILKPVDALEISVFVGSQKSGIVCTGGACRTVPAFHGVKSRVTVAF